MLCVTGIALLITVFAVAANRFLLSAIFGKVDEEVMRNAEIYFYLIALSFPFMGIYNASAALSRAMGDSKITMLISVFMNVVNIVGNAVLILVFHLGVYGVALSTLFSRILGALILFGIMRREERKLHYSRRITFAFDKDIIKNIMRIGIPTGLDNCIFQVGKILVQSLIAGLGTVAIAANAIAGVVAGVAVIPAPAMGIAMITVVGQAVGAGAAGRGKALCEKNDGIFLSVYGSAEYCDYFRSRADRGPVSGFRGNDCAGGKGYYFPFRMRHAFVAHRFHPAQRTARRHGRQFHHDCIDSLHVDVPHRLQLFVYRVFSYGIDGNLGRHGCGLGFPVSLFCMEDPQREVAEVKQKE